MSKPKWQQAMAVRVPASLLSALDQYVADCTKATPWRTVSRSDAARELLTLALARIAADPQFGKMPVAGAVPTAIDLSRDGADDARARGAV